MYVKIGNKYYTIFETSKGYYYVKNGRRVYTKKEPIIGPKPPLRIQRRKSLKKGRKIRKSATLRPKVKKSRSRGRKSVRKSRGRKSRGRKSRGRKPCKAGQVRDRSTKRCRKRKPRGRKKSKGRKSTKKRRSPRKSTKKSRRSPRRKSTKKSRRSPKRRKSTKKSRRSPRRKSTKKSRRSPRRKSSSPRKTPKKYLNRPSPPHPANKFPYRGTIEEGNDGKMYKSTRASNGVYRWKKI